jgi:glycosyltransferase involved in cell wall biosynthesis
MRVAFNGLFLQEPHTGTGRYTYNLLQSLGRVDGINEYLVLSPHQPKVIPDTPSTFTWKTVPVGRLGISENVEKVVWEQRTFPQAAKHADARVMHVPHFAPPLRGHGIPTIVTIHDVINLRLPVYRASASAQLYGRLVQRAVRHTALIITVSEFSKRDIVETLGVPEERVRVVSEAPAAQYRRVTDGERLREVCARYGLGERFVLNVGGMDARKNIAGLIGAFAAVYHQLRDPELRLFIAGEVKRLGSSPLFPDWRPLAATFGVLDRIVCLPVDEADLPALYSAAVCFAFASHYEGFGLPPLEAMACGAPIVCSNRTSLPEVVGSAGMLIDPDDPDAFGNAILRVLTLPPVHDDLRLRGLARVRQFSWDQVAVETSALYAEVAGTKRE